MEQTRTIRHTTPARISPLRAAGRVVPALCLLLVTSGLFGQGLPFFLDQARSGSVEERAAAFHELADFQGPEVEAALSTGLSDPAAEVRQAAAVSAIGHSSEVVTTALIKVFHDQSLEVQHTAISVFIMNNNPLQAGYRPLLSLLEAPDPGTRAYAAWAVGLYHNPGAIDRLTHLFDGGNELQRANVCWAVGEIGSPRGLELVHKAMGDTAPAVREKAAAAVGRIGDPSSTARLEALLKAETDGAVRRAAQQSLESLAVKKEPAGE